MPVKVVYYLEIVDVDSRLNAVIERMRIDIFFHFGFESRPVIKPGEFVRQSEFLITIVFLQENEQKQNERGEHTHDYN